MKITNLIDKLAFDKMSKAQKRVALALDVIARIKQKNIKAGVGDLFSNSYDIESAVEYGKSASIKEVINSTPCEVCAKGALLASFIGNFNRYKEVSSFSPNLDREYPTPIKKIFGRVLLDAIEVCFERDCFHWTSVKLGRYEYSLRNAFFEENDNKRLAQVMKNIAVNEGNLVVKDKIGDDKFITIR